MKPRESGASLRSRRNRGETGRGFEHAGRPRTSQPPAVSPEPPPSELAARLRRLDRRPYGSYRTLVGTYRLGDFEIVIDHVAGAAAAGASRMRVGTSTATAGVLARWTADPGGRLAIEDLVARVAARAVVASGLDRPGAAPGSGGITVESPGASIVERGACRVADGAIELRVLVDLPAQGRMIRGLAAERLLTEDLLRLAKATLLFGPGRSAEAEVRVAAVRRHRALQSALAARGLVAFFSAGGAPRLPEAFAVEIELEHETVRGVGLPAGVTLIAGGALQGKSALLETIAAGVHPHSPEDPRAGVVTTPSAATIRAERGRSLERADLSPFLRVVPAGPDPDAVTIRPAPPALAQAAAASEAIAAGSTLLLFDEDDSAPAFLARDGRMQRLVAAADTALIPLIDRARDLYDELGVSTIIATSAIGDFIDVAHTTLLVRDGQVEDATDQGARIAAATRGTRSVESRPPVSRPRPRVVPIDTAPPATAPRIALHGREGIRVGTAIVDLGASATGFEPGRRRALGALLARTVDSEAPTRDLGEVLDGIERQLDERGLDALTTDGGADLARPRRVEIAAALLRGRSSTHGVGR